MCSLNLLVINSSVCDIYNIFLTSKNQLSLSLICEFYSWFLNLTKEVYEEPIQDEAYWTTMADTYTQALTNFTSTDVPKVNFYFVNNRKILQLLFLESKRRPDGCEILNLYINWGRFWINQFTFFPVLNSIAVDVYITFISK